MAKKDTHHQAGADDTLEARREAARRAAREAQELDRAEEGEFEADQARGHHHESDPFEPHEKEALDDAALGRGTEKAIEDQEERRQRD
jgi:hypothetical protein